MKKIFFNLCLFIYIFFYLHIDELREWAKNWQPSRARLAVNKKNK
jgi:hypothetical protein